MDGMQCPFSLQREMLFCVLKIRTQYRGKSVYLSESKVENMGSGVIVHYVLPSLLINAEK